MKNESIQILTPVGRLVSGDCFQGRNTDYSGKPLTVKTGPNAGQPRTVFDLGLAISKTNPEVNSLLNQIHQAAQIGFPELFDAQGNCRVPQFAFKYTDGDSQIPNRNGRKPCDREGFPGHWVFWFSGGNAPRCYRKGGTQQIIDPEEIKRGYYIRIAGSVRANGEASNPGVYLNHSLVELQGYGEEIIVGPDPTSVFGGNPVAQLPAGASATPLPSNVGPASASAPGAPVPGGLPGGPTPTTTPVPSGMVPQTSPGALPGAPIPGGALPPNVTPQTGYMAPPPPAVPAPPSQSMQQPAERTYVVDGQSYTYEQLKGFGWTDEQIQAIPDQIPF